MGQVLSQYVDADGRHRVTWLHSGVVGNGRIIQWKFASEVPQAELQARFNDIVRDMDYGWIERADLTWDEAVLIDFVKRLRNNPTATLNQFNQWLNTKQWYQSAEIKVFMFKLAKHLAVEYGVVLADYTDTQIYTKVRDWIVNADVNTLKRVCFGKFMEI